MPGRSQFCPSHSLPCWFSDPSKCVDLQPCILFVTQHGPNFVSENRSPVRSSPAREVSLLCVFPWVVGILDTVLPDLILEGDAITLFKGRVCRTVLAWGVWEWRREGGPVAREGLQAAQPNQGSHPQEPVGNLGEKKQRWARLLCLFPPISKFPA